MSVCERERPTDVLHVHDFNGVFVADVFVAEPLGARDHRGVAHVGEGKVAVFGPVHGRGP